MKNVSISSDRTVIDCPYLYFVVYDVILCHDVIISKKASCNSRPVPHCRISQCTVVQTCLAASRFRRRPPRRLRTRRATTSTSTSTTTTTTPCHPRSVAPPPSHATTITKIFEILITISVRTHTGMVFSSKVLIFDVFVEIAMMYSCGPITLR